MSDSRCSFTKCIRQDSEFCHLCKRRADYRDYYAEYVPTCKHGYRDCILDPAYTLCHSPDWYKELHGDAKPADVVCTDCDDGEQYDDEDK